MVQKGKTIKLLKENTGIDLFDFRLGHSFLSMESKAQTITTTTKKIDKLNNFKIKNACVSRATSRK